MNSSILKGLSLLAMALVSAPLLAATAAPIPIRDADRPSAQPVTGACTINPNATFPGQCAMYNVPAGKLLVVETVSWEGSTQNGDVLPYLLVGAENNVRFYMFIGPQVSAINPGPITVVGSSYYYSGAQSVRLYLTAGQDFDARFPSTNNVYPFTCMFTGYLVDA